MADIKKWCQPETTKHAIFDGFYPVVISMGKTFEKEVEKDDKTFKREVVALTIKTLGDVPFPDGTSGKIIVEQQYNFDSQFHVNALNGTARAAGVKELTNTDQLEGKTLMMGIINRYWNDNEGITHAQPQLGFGLFSYAPLTEDSQVEFVATDHPGVELTDEILKEWFKKKVALYKSPK